MSAAENQKLTILLKIASISVFLGRAWQFIFWEVPYKVLLWDQNWMESIISFVLGIPWEDYTTSSTTDLVINNIVLVTGFLYLFTAILILFYRKQKWATVFICFSTFNLLLLFLLITKETLFHLGQFFEHSAQLMSPVLLIAWARQKLTKEQLLFSTKIIIAITFISHGLYAVGYYPRPDAYVNLMINTFGVSDAFAHKFILVAGFIDFIVAILIFVPGFSFYALRYMVVWGFATAFSRVIANFYWDFIIESLHQSFYLFVYRIPHGVIPLTAIYLMKRTKIFNPLKRKSTL